MNPREKNIKALFDEVYPISDRSFRAVEQGHSILRSTRFGLSAAINPYGELVAQMSSFDGNDKIMEAHLPEKGVMTVYRLIGDAFVYICMGFVLWLVIRASMKFNPV